MVKRKVSISGGALGWRPVGVIDAGISFFYLDPFFQESLRELF